MQPPLFDAVIFDLDGVITQTALVHSAAWKNMFDEYLREREKKHGEPFTEFSHKEDYLKYVDGKPRYEGVKSFLQSRGIEIPFGNPGDDTAKETICGIGNRKNEVFNQTLRSEGVKSYESTVSLIKTLKEKGVRIGVASSSKNAGPVLRAAGLEDLIETRVDGIVSAELNLKGKPEPDIFTRACDNLGVPYDRAVVVEDAESGVRAGRQGNFGLVLGLARENNEQELLRNGADIVVKDIEELGYDGIQEWFRTGLAEDHWKISYHDYAPEKEKTRETLLTVGNGYLGTRGAMEEMQQGKHNYPGTYMAGLYNRLVSKVADKDIENEDFVNAINWLPVNFKVGKGRWIDINNVEILEINRSLDLRKGLLSKEMVLKDKDGKMTRIRSKRMASMHNPHIMTLVYDLTPLNYSGTVSCRSALRGDHINAGVERYKQLEQKHIKPIESGYKDGCIYLRVATTQSDIRISAAAMHQLCHQGKELQSELITGTGEGFAEISFDHYMNEGDTLTINKICAIYKSDDEGISDPVFSAISALLDNHDLEKIITDSVAAWDSIWKRTDIKLEGDRLAQKLLRLHLYHLMITTSPHNEHIDFGIPARGLHGEAYRGHIFWDELYILPFYNLHFPRITRSVLMYRYRRLDEARKYAEAHGYEGAMFPWQSGSSGREETQVLHLNPVSGKWGPDHSSLQRHVSLAIAYNVWSYYWQSRDLDFMANYGAEMLAEICRFWASKAIFNSKTGRYSIEKVMGPDEFHEKNPGAKEGGLRDNAYTNIMVIWLMQRTVEIFQQLDNKESSKIIKKLKLNESEWDKWQDLAGKMNIIINEEGVLSQFDGYFDLKELDWDHYREKYGNIHRMDRILKAEGKSPDEFKVSKQADTLQVFYNLSAEVVSKLITDAGYRMPDDYLGKNLKYYLARTSHGSTLSRIVHARLANMVDDMDLSWKLYMDALTSDYQDIQGGTTAEGIHAGVIAGTILVALQSYAGLDLQGEEPKLNPKLPEHWRRMEFGFTFKGKNYRCEVTRDEARMVNR